MRESIVDLPEFHSKQLLIYETEATQLLLAGDTRGGKTAGFKLSLIRWSALIPGLQTEIYRFYEADVIEGYMKGDFGFESLLYQWEADGLVHMTQTSVEFLFNGSRIELRHCSTDAAMKKGQGIPKHVRAFDEAGQIPERRLRWLTQWTILNESEKAKLPPERS